jgi:catechol 2,3-dioxygenase-like lactoylglutathione lyase family enzyme
MATLQQVIPVLHMTHAEASKHFYCNLLGFGLAFEAPVLAVEPDPSYLGLVRDGLTLHLSSHAGDAVVGGVALFLVDDVDALHAEFVARSAPIHLAPIDQTWGMREMYVRDPDGNTLRFATPVARG